ncbi:UNVERIFIED_CONTAM: hypothetical protein Slati_0206600 [Sesamum latifolium]|uniref:Uncharacterized protein n=1 Tax=Sesamum latifolium TaxID=2727402 RepID=A0AAW2YBV1_9LAMI
MAPVKRSGVAPEVHQMSEVPRFTDLKPISVQNVGTRPALPSPQQTGVGSSALPYNIGI